MKAKILLLFIFSVIFTSCAMNYITFNANKSINNVELGMSKSEVIRIMGDLYITNSSSLSTTGEKEEVLVYKSDTTEEFRLKFLDSKLISWDRIHINAIISEKQQQ